MNKLPRPTPRPGNPMVLHRPENVGQWVRTQRQLMKMTQSELAQKANVTQRMISEFETGKTTMRLDTLYRVFQILKLRLAAVDLKVPEEPEEEEEW
ncbi:MAG: helix-turn-helix domain-containing protein [Sutterella parvirubra]|nr:helix-turn-helix domain-containing protein [Sutterella parvirubra]MDR3771241.1 helix-turn-helix transcriptional regulator [Sutterella sp.]MDY5201777.1 helix-turn-helix transcriptional regulator [Sutterella parvirubra]